MAINTQLLALRFENATGCTSAKAQYHTQRYLQQCAQAMLQDHFGQDSGSGYYINQTQIQNTLADIVVKKQRFYVWQTFQEFPERVFDIVVNGNNLQQKITMVRSRYTLEEVIVATGTPEELIESVYQPYQQQIQSQDYDVVDIDMRSLQNYIRSNLAGDRNNPQTPAKLIEEWDTNLKHAQRIWKLATAADNQLIQIRSESTFGRRYYRGPNLQNTPKIVRHAALGQCHEYDIESSVFAWKLSWFRSICQSHDQVMPMPATLDLLDNKKAVRKRLALAVFDTDADWAVQVIKQFITAIGFGAPLRGVGYVVNDQYQSPALAQIITARTRLDRAMADTWVQEFVREQQDMNTAIVTLARINMLSELQQVPELWDQGKRKIKPNSVVSYLYQHAERELLDWAENFCDSSEVLLTVHDCIYTRRPVNLAEFRWGIQQWGEFYKLSHTRHHAYGWEDPVDTTDPFYDPREAVVAKRHNRSQGTLDVYTGAGHDGTQEYDLELDPFFQQEQT
jgi:hypothetical protein